RRHLSTPTRRGFAVNVQGFSHTPANSETITLACVSETTTSAGSPPTNCTVPSADSWRSTGADRFVSRNAISCSYRSGASIRRRRDLGSLTCRVPAFAAKLRGLSFLFAVLTAIFPVGAAFLNLTFTGWVGALGGIGHREPPEDNITPTSRRRPRFHIRM